MSPLEKEYTLTVTSDYILLAGKRSVVYNKIDNWNSSTTPTHPVYRSTPPNPCTDFSQLEDLKFFKKITTDIG
jgi:hypothetical protein